MSRARAARAHCSPTFGSTAEVLRARLLEVAAREVLLLPSSGLFSSGGTTGNGLGPHKGEGIWAKQSKPSGQQALLKVVTKQSGPTQSVDVAPASMWSDCCEASLRQAPLHHTACSAYRA